MTKKIKFLHTADIHLGSLLSSGIEEPPPFLASLFKNAVYESFKLIINQAINYNVDFVIISGDLYDQEARSVKASKFFKNQCERLKTSNIPIYIIAGNHDPGGRKKEPFTLPDNVNIFTSQKVESKNFLDNDGYPVAKILGQSYRQKFESRKMYSYYSDTDENIFNLGLLHTQLDPQNRKYVPVSKNDLLNKDDIDYWALGHIHKPRVVNSDVPSIIFPGTPQGRNMKEKGLKGCFMIELTEKETPDIKFVPTSKVIFKKIELKISQNEDKNLKNITDIKEKFIEKAESILQQGFVENNNFLKNNKLDIQLTENNKNSIKGIIVHWVFKGRGPFHQFIEDNREEVIENILKELNNIFSHQKPFLWSHSLTFLTGYRPTILEEFKENDEIFKEVENVINDILEKEGLQNQLYENWGKIWTGESDYEEQDLDKFFPDKEITKEILNKARKLILDDLVSRGEDFEN